MKSITYLSLLDWYLTKQRPQHFAELLSKKFKVSYICSVGWKQKEIIEKHSEGDDLKSTLIQHNSNLTIYRKRLLPGGRYKSIRKINDWVIKGIVEDNVKRNNSEYLWITHPYQFSLIPKSYSGSIIYDCMDNYEQFTENVIEQKKIKNFEIKLTKRADFVFTSSDSLKNKLSNYTNKDIHLVSNAVNFELFNKAEDKKNIKIKPKEISNKFIVGYFGGIGSWFDYQLIDSLANNFPQVDFLLIGPISNDNVKKLSKKYNNVITTGAVKYEVLPNYLAYFNVCIMPFKLTKLIEDVNPVKLYEYLSAGKQVIATKYGETEKFGNMISLYSNEREFEQILCDLIKIKDKKDDLKFLRIEFAKTNTWEKRVEEIINILRSYEN